MLEHCADPRRPSASCAATAPGGRVLASTHGVQVYHPAPDDLWRWTHTGLERLFRDNADWTAVRVEPGAGTAACVGMLLGTFMHLLAKRLGAPALAKPAIAALERRRGALDRRVPSLREPRPGAIFANYHVDGSGVMARKVVTGGGGFIGSNLVRGLLARDAVRVLDNFATGSRTNLDDVADDVEVVEASSPRERVHNAVRGVEVVFHLGALGSCRIRAGPADDERRQRRGDAERPARGARRGDPARGIRVVVVRLRLRDRAAGARGRPGRPDLALRRGEAGGRALLRLVQPCLPLVRDGGAALLQRLRAAAEPTRSTPRSCRCSSPRSRAASR